MADPYTLPGLPSDILSTDQFGERRMKTEVSSAVQRAADSGAVFISGGRQSLAAGEEFFLAGENPAGSGYRVKIFLLSAYTSDDSALDISFILNPTVGVNTPSVNTNFNVSDTTTPSVLNVSSGIDTLTGGTATSVAVEITRDGAWRFEGPPSMVVDPGNTLALTILAPGGLTGSRRASANVAWTIEAV